MRDSHIRSARFLEFARLAFGFTSPSRLHLAKHLAVTLVLLAAAPATGHHVGAYVPRDNEVSANFKQLKFSIQARKFDVAARLFETGAIRVEMRARAGRIPSGLEEATRAALVAGDGPRAERDCRREQAGSDTEVDSATGEAGNLPYGPKPHESLCRHVLSSVM